MKKAPISQRLGSHLLESFLQAVTLGIGWLVWNFFTVRNGQTPAKKLLKLQVINPNSRTPLSGGQMLRRQLYIFAIYNVWWIYLIVLGIFAQYNVVSGLQRFILATALIVNFILVIVDFIWLLTDDNRRLIDYWSDSAVVEIIEETSSPIQN